MASTGRPTKGMQILGIRMFMCDFGFMPEEEVNPRIAALAESDRRLDVKTDVRIVDSEVDPEKPDIAQVAIIVETNGVMKDIVCWSIRVGHQGLFRVAGDGDVTLDSVLKIHGPAQLYSFAREFVADISRRAEISARGIYVPPWNFQAVSGE